jgi:hypothetical protein
MLRAWLWFYTNYFVIQNNGIYPDDERVEDNNIWIILNSWHNDDHPINCTLRFRKIILNLFTWSDYPNVKSFTDKWQTNIQYPKYKRKHNGTAGAIHPRPDAWQVPRTRLRRSINYVSRCRRPSFIIIYTNRSSTLRMLPVAQERLLSSSDELLPVDLPPYTLRYTYILIAPCLTLYL